MGSIGNPKRASVFLENAMAESSGLPKGWEGRRRGGQLNAAFRRKIEGDLGKFRILRLGGSGEPFLLEIEQKRVAQKLHRFFLLHLD